MEVGREIHIIHIDMQIVVYVNAFCLCECMFGECDKIGVKGQRTQTTDGKTARRHSIFETAYNEVIQINIGKHMNRKTENFKLLGVI